MSRQAVDLEGEDLGVLLPELDLLRIASVLENGVPWSTGVDSDVGHPNQEIARLSNYNN